MFHLFLKLCDSYYPFNTKNTILHSAVKTSSIGTWAKRGVCSDRERALALQLEKIARTYPRRPVVFKLWPQHQVVPPQIFASLPLMLDPLLQRVLL